MRAMLFIVLLAILAGCEDAKPQPKPKAVAKKKPVAKKIVSTMESQRGKLVEKEPTPEPDRKWIDDARRQLRAAREIRGETVRADAERLGGMNKGERMQAMHALRLVKEHGVGGVALQLRDMASKVAPDYMRTMKRDEAVRLGELPGYPDQKRRKEHWDNLEKILGPLSGNHNLPTFATLDEKEMLSAVRVAKNAVAGGLGSVSGEDRHLLLAVGALDWFGKQLDIAETKP